MGILVLLLVQLGLGLDDILEMQGGYTVEYFSQQLDHINGDPGLINIKVILKTGDPEGPLFVYMGGEGPIEAFFGMTGFLVAELGPAFNATVAFIEHRYYGDSIPLEPGYAYLSTDQALLDFASIVMLLKPSELTKVVCFGGSYGGMLSAFFRIKFPHLVDGAISSSGPVFEYLDTKGQGLMHTTTQAYYNVMPNCAFNINAGFNILDAFAGMEYTWPALTAMFGLCAPITEAGDVLNLEDYISNAFENIAQVNYPYPATVLSYLPGNPVEVACSMIAYDNQFPANMWMVLRGLADVTNLFYNSTRGETCNDISSGNGLDSWGYQTCSELVIPQGGYGVPNDMFPLREWDISGFSAFCNSTYGVTPNLEWYQLNYGFTEYYMYGLRNLTNVVFTYGTIDPWQSGCIKEAPSPGTLVMGIAGAAHHYDLRQPNPNDSNSVRYTRRAEFKSIQQWVS